MKQPLGDTGNSRLNDDNPRLKVFPAQRVARCRKDLTTPDPAPWPQIEGCLTALFTARSGSTLLCRQLETLFDVGEMGEKLNPSKLKQRSAQSVIAARTAPWFSFKCGVAPLIHLELLGFFDAYLHNTVFVHLVRRDVVAQAVSYAKASQSGQWHADREPPGDAAYDSRMIAASVRAIVVQVEQMKRYAERTGRPHTRLLYEDIAVNGLATAKAAGGLLGLPMRPRDADGALLRPIEKMGDEINDEWKARFLREMDVSVGRLVEDYVASIDLGAAPRWATSEHVPHHKILKKAMERETRFDAVLAKLPAWTASRAGAVVEALRARFPTGTVFVKDDEDGEKLTIRFGPERDAASAIFTIVARAGEVKIVFEGDHRIADPAGMLRQKNGRRYLVVEDVSTAAGDAVLALFDQAVRHAPTPLPCGDRGEIVVRSRTRKQEPR